MGLMDKMKDAVKDADTKLGNAVDKGKLDSQIRDEERAIEKCVADIGKAVVDALKAGKTAAEADIGAFYEKIRKSEERIEDFKKQKEEIDSSEKKE